VSVNPNPLGREYTDAEIAASKRLGISERGLQASPGPLFYATGPYLPGKWRKVAADAALVSAALDREWPKTMPGKETR
jgi:hypothetical protein